MYIHVPSRSSLAGLAEVVGPLEGSFAGPMTSDEKMPAGQAKTTTITAQLTHRDARVSGTIGIGAGLQLKFPGMVCRLEPVDVRSFAVAGAASAANPRHAEVSGLITEPTTQIPGATTIDIAVSIVGDLSADGRTLTTRVTMKPKNPLCGERTFDLTLVRTP